jgi:hypothetical protein
MKRSYIANRVSNKNASQDLIPSYGKSGVRAGSRLACLCANRKTYSKECCKGYLLNQTIGNTIAPYPNQGRAFSQGFSDGFS